MPAPRRRSHVLTPTLAALLVMPIVAVSAPSAVATDDDRIPWSFHDCLYLYASVLVPVALIQDKLPPNFRPFFVNPATAGRVASMGFEFDLCERGTALEGEVSPMHYASTWVPTLPPPQYAEAGVGKFVGWDMLVPDDARRAYLADRTVPVHAGSVSFGADFRDGIPRDPFSVSATQEGLGTFTVDVVPAQGGATVPGGGVFEQFTPNGDGSLSSWRTAWNTYGNAGQGAAVVHLPPESWQAQALGPVVVGRAAYGQWDYANGTIDPRV